MGLIAKDLPSLVFMLLPGFMAAGVFYTLTAHPKSSEFERVVQALIFTTILRVLTAIARATTLGIGARIGRAIGRWTPDVELGWSVVLALVIGLLFASLANHDTFHGLLRKLRITVRTSYPSEWYGAFARDKRWVILHLKGGRRIYGWPEEWPDQAEKGHFALSQPEWLLDDNTPAPLLLVERFLIPASEVELVEFLKDDDAIARLDTEAVDLAEQTLVRANREPSDGSEGAAAGPEAIQ